MEEPYASETANGESAERFDDDTYSNAKRRRHQEEESGEDSLYGVVKGLLWSIFCTDPSSGLAGTSLFHRAKTSLRRDLPLLRDASRTTGLRILRWTRQGSSLRALLVISVGTVAFLTLSALLIFLVFFLVATFNAIIISLLMSLVAAGGFLALFFACVVAIYIGALSVALFVISTATISAIVAVLIATGWIGFLWTVWFAMKKSAGIARKSINLTGSAISAYSYSWHARRHSHRHHD
ncbi:hypothetical protein Nepgr_028666 [Nepenthes gracilis]|uniref:Uncharacterized protein n=1 Tax=Nepenthes gracilis TaxID=150966 RepID=A0AAD3TB67_NEPGR|nr:hypothetical protein Nepgr_028666 [Nepenthes gracilis]